MPRLPVPLIGMAGNRQLVRAYVDETGDRGVSAKSSRFFAMAAVVVADEEEQHLRAAVQACKQAFKVPPSKPLHWQEHVKVHPRRQYVAKQLGGVPGLVVNYVIFEKAAIPLTSGVHSDRVIFYNYAAGLMMERLLLTARDWTDGPRDLIARFSHVRGHDDKETLTYFAIKQVNDPGWIPWHLLHGSVKFSDHGSWDGLQAADQYAGMLKVALVADEYGGYEEHHLMAVRHQVRRAYGKTWGVGFKAMARPGTFESYPWWPAEGL